MNPMSSIVSPLPPPDTMKLSPILLSASAALTCATTGAQAADAPPAPADELRVFVGQPMKGYQLTIGDFERR